MKVVAFLLAFTVALSACERNEPTVVSSTNGIAAGESACASHTPHRRGAVVARCPPQAKGAPRVQCHSVTKSGNRCKRKAAPGKFYCRQHAAQSPAAKPSEACAYISDDGKRCAASAESGSRFCSRHKQKGQ